MIKVLLANSSEKETLQGTYINGAVLEFILDNNNNWVVNIEVLYDNNFLEIKKELLELPIIEYTPKNFNDHNDK
jgi:hypothetical protein